jgi:hypothetical protein
VEDGTVQYGPVILQIAYCLIQRSLHNIKCNWYFGSCKIVFQFLRNANQAYQISVSKNKNSIFGELFHLIFRILHDNWSKIIGDEFLIFDCMDI